MKKSRTHSFIVTITTDKQCPRKVALREIRDVIYGQHYCTPYEDDEPEEFRIRSVRSAPQGKKR